MGALKITSENFQSEILKTGNVALVDFWAEWCGPCKMMGPIVDEVFLELKGKVKVGKINVDEEQELASKYGIMSIPTFIIFKNGEIVEQLTGAMPKGKLIDKINSYL